jgi:hypothetical protein
MVYVVIRVNPNAHRAIVVWAEIALLMTALSVEIHVSMIANAKVALFVQKAFTPVQQNVRVFSMPARQPVRPTNIAILS